MKYLLKIAVVFGALLLAIPMLAFLKPEHAEEIAGENALQDTVQEENAFVTGDTLKVLDYTSGQVIELPLRDYVIGAVLAEMPAMYHIEALKAQAVAARTYAVRQREKQRINPDKLLMGADISNDSTKYQAYFTDSQAKTFYGESYETVYDIVSGAADATEGEVLVCSGEPIVAAFHSISSGRTESAEIVWGSPVEYLVPVESPADEASPEYLNEKIFTEAELRARLEAEYDGMDFSSPPDNWIELGDKSLSGTIISLTAGGKELSGMDFRQLFGLRSANFAIEHSDGSFIITTKGNGHGVGMSQYGANAMANNGADYREILLHYYTGAEITLLNPVQHSELSILTNPDTV